MSISKNICMYRKARALTLTELAFKANVAKSCLSEVETEIQTNPSIKFLEKIAEALEVDLRLLLEEELNEELAALDEEWHLLITEAMESGVSQEEFADFLADMERKMKQQQK